MEYVIKPKFQQFENWAWWDNIFTTEELDYLQQRCITATKNGIVGNRNEDALREDIRRCKIDWLHYSSDVEWVYAKVSHAINSLNDSYFNFEITGFAEPMQLTNYLSGNSGAYTWHRDCGKTGARKLSFTMQLTEPSDYEGGELQVLDDRSTPTTLAKKRGLIVVFPSFTLHQVTPVTKGSRQSLVAWITGPQFR